MFLDVWAFKAFIPVKLYMYMRMWASYPCAQPEATIAFPFLNDRKNEDARSHAVFRADQVSYQMKMLSLSRSKLSNVKKLNSPSKRHIE